MSHFSYRESRDCANNRNWAPTWWRENASNGHLTGSCTAMTMTDVTNTRLPYTKCTRRYGELSRNFQKTPSSSHSSYHKRLGTRLHALLILLHTFLPQEHEQIPPQTFNRDAAWDLHTRSLVLEFTNKMGRRHGWKVVVGVLSLVGELWELEESAHALIVIWGFLIWSQHGPTILHLSTKSWVQMY